MCVCFTLGMGGGEKFYFRGSSLVAGCIISIETIEIVITARFIYLC